MDILLNWFDTDEAISLDVSFRRLKDEDDDVEVIIVLKAGVKIAMLYFIPELKTLEIYRLVGGGFDSTYNTAGVGGAEALVALSDMIKKHKNYR